MRSLTVSVLVVLLAAPPAVAQQSQDASDRWRALAGDLEPGASVTVHLKDGRSIKGRFLEVAGDTIRLNPQTRTQDREFTFDTIQSINVHRGPSPGKVVLWIAVAVGAALLAGFLLAMPKT